MKRLLEKPLFKNFLSLGFFQATNYLFPLISYPLLIRIMGIENMGKIFFAQALVTYFTVITDFGFNYTSTRDISQNRENIKKVSDIFSLTISAKLFLIIVSFLLFTALCFIIPDLKNNLDLYVKSFPIVIGQALLPFWLFQGLEKMKFITIINFISKLSFLLVIIFLLKSPDSFAWVNFSLGMSNVFASLLILLYASSKLGIKFSFVSPTIFLKRLNADKYLFYSMLSSTFLTNSNILILGIFSTNTVVGQFGVAEKIYTTLKQILGLFSLGTYPRVCLYIKESRSKLIGFFKSTYAYFNLLVILACLSLYALAPYIILIFTGDYNVEITRVFYILIPALFVVGLNIAPNHTIMAMNESRKYSLVFLIAAISNLILNFLLVVYLLQYGTAIAILITEIILTFGLFLLLGRYWKRAEIFNIFVPKALKL
ncbi:flippase [Hyphobacterium sp. CCMP332]|nr:flippase [Hyphobacterium sp. CCMP332]